MKPAQFAYYAPNTIEQAVATLAEVAADDGRVIAGGQSLVPAMALRIALPKHLVDINGVFGLDRLGIEADHISIGACVRHSAFQRPVIAGPLGRMLADVVRHIAHHPIQTRGTFCGSLANADPSSEWCLIAATLGAVLVARSGRGSRLIQASAFFQGVMTTALAADELLVDAQIPLLAEDARWGFCEFNRRKGDFAIAMSLVTYRLEAGLIASPFVGVGGVESFPRRIPDAERILVGQRPDPELFRAAANSAAAAVIPMPAHFETVSYKRDLVRAAVWRALQSADKR